MPFSARTLTFLRGLKAHNEKPWFESHRAQYERDVKAPLRDLVEEMDVRFARFAPEFVGDPKKSVFRIYRDVRFSRDKQPYKTHASCWFFHRDGSRRVGQEAEDGGAGFYFQIAPGNAFIAGGIWMPPRRSLGKIRDAIAEDPGGFVKLARAPALVKRFGGLDDEAKLTRMPRGYPPEHPAGEWLKLQSFTVGRVLTDAQAISGKLPALLEKDYEVMLPMVRWVNGVLGLKAAMRR